VCGDFCRRLDEYVQNMHHFTLVLEEEASRVGLYINPDNCKVMVSNTWSGTADNHVQGSTVEVVDKFCYLVSYISHNGNCEQDVKVHIGRASSIFGKMKKVWGKSTSICRQSWDCTRHSSCRLFFTAQTVVASYRHIEQETGSSPRQVAERHSWYR